MIFCCKQLWDLFILNFYSPSAYTKKFDLDEITQFLQDDSRERRIDILDYEIV